MGRCRRIDCRIEHDLADYRLLEPLLRRPEAPGTKRGDF
jgi:hypothetical protein